MKMALGLTFPGDLQDDSVICYVCKHFNINMNIIEASFSMSSGWAFIELEGEKEEIEKVLDHLSDKNIKIQQIKAKK